MGEATKRLLRDIGYFSIFVLMIFGIVGLLYHALGKEGWIDKILDGVFHQGIGAVTGITIAVLMGWWLGRRVLRATQTNAVFNDFLMYGLVALGLFFIGRLTLYGSL